MAILPKTDLSGEKANSVDPAAACAHFEHMPRKTVSIDPDVYRGIKRLQQKHESISGTLRRVLELVDEDEKDPADYLDELFREYGGKGFLGEEGRKLILERRKNPPRSSRPPRP